MKNKILIFALCFTLLLGLFSISAFAEDETITDLTGMTFSFENPIISSGYGKFNVNGVIDCTTISHGKKNEGFKKLLIGFDTYGSSKKGFISYDDLDSGSDEMIDVSQVFTITFTGGDDVTNSSLISWVLENKLAHVHSYSSSVIQPTHVDKGYTLYTCECGNTYKDNYVNALGHDYTIVTQPSTCTVKGSSTYSCSCGHSYTEELALLPHNYTVDVKPSTCTVKGYKVSTCTCGHVLRETLDLLPHSHEVVTIESTCSVPGSNIYTCSCGHSYSEKLPKLDHTFVDGRCSVCNALDPSLYKDSEDNILIAWSEVYKDFFGLFGSAQSIFYDGSNLTLIGGLVIIGLVLGLGFLLFLVIEKFIHFRW